MPCILFRQEQCKALDRAPSCKSVLGRWHNCFPVGTALHRRDPVWQRLGLAVGGQGRQAQGVQDPQRREPLGLRRHPHPHDGW
jgi:hypothetical protein